MSSTVDHAVVGSSKSNLGSRDDDKNLNMVKKNFYTNDTYKSNISSAYCYIFLYFLFLLLLLGISINRSESDQIGKSDWMVLIFIVTTRNLNMVLIFIYLKVG